MRLLVDICHKRVLKHTIEHMWPISKKVMINNTINKKKQTVIEDYGWPRSNKELLKQKNKGILINKYTLK